MSEMTVFVSAYRRFRGKDDGNATIEFVFLFPAFIFLFLLGFESGYYMVRNVMLERAVDIAVRDVRLGNGKVPQFEALKQRICDEAAILDDCVNSVQIEMQPVAIVPGGTASVRTAAKCVDRLSTDDPLTGTTYNAGAANSMMMVRVCALSKPLFPTTGIGVGMQVDAEGNYAIVATTAFVNEPGSRAVAPYTAPTPVGNPGPTGGSGSGDSDASTGASGNGGTNDPNDNNGGLN